MADGERFKRRPPLGTRVKLAAGMHGTAAGAVAQVQSSDPQRVRVDWDDGLTTGVRCEQLVPEGPPRPPSGAERIFSERSRQVAEEGYTAEHDRGQALDLMMAAEAYVTHSRGARWHTLSGNERSPSFWPWREEFWKPTGDPIADLTKAGALIAAAIDALQDTPGA